MLATFANKLSNYLCIFTAQSTLSTFCVFQQVRRCYIYFNDNRAVCIGATKGKILTFTSCIAWKGIWIIIITDRRTEERTDGISRQ